MRKNFFPERIVNHWNRLAREVVKSPSLVTIPICFLLFKKRTYTDVAFSAMVWWARGGWQKVGPNDFRVLFQSK